MSERIVRRPFEVGGNTDVVSAIQRYRELREWKKGAEQELKEIQEKLSVQLAEHDATELAVGGLPAVRLTEYDRVTVSAGELRVKHPRLFARFAKITHIVRVDIT